MLKNCNNLKAKREAEELEALRKRDKERQRIVEKQRAKQREESEAKRKQLMMKEQVLTSHKICFFFYNF